ncbi:MAG: bifunctional DNA primase/polymerase [bacterium]|nr:bifunctional DNA primase/polymerase [bacterium]
MIQTNYNRVFLFEAISISEVVTIHINNQLEILNQALAYRALGWSVIPVGFDKKPLFLWKKYQTHHATEDEIRKWWLDYPYAQIGIVTGAVSGIVVIDVEAEGNFEGFPSTVTVKSGSGGRHYYYKHPGHSVSNNVKKIRKHTDIRGDGGYIVVPPSRSDKGKYEWIKALGEIELAEIPEWLKKTNIANSNDKKWLYGKDGVAEGSRNDTAASMAGKIISSTTHGLLESLGWEQFKVWNNKNTPPLLETELRRTWESVKKYHIQDGEPKMGEGKGKQTIADLLIKIVTNTPGVKLFHTEKNEPFICFPVDGHIEYAPCKSKTVKRWLANEYWKTYKKSPNGDAISGALNVIEGKACFEGEKKVLENRVAFVGEEIWFDMANDKWETIQINKEGWELIEHPPVIFRRYSHQKGQSLPTKGGNLSDIFKYINVKHEDQKILLLAWIISCFIPNIPHPVLYIYGPQGSAKSTTCKFLRSIIDPSVIEVAEFPKKLEEFIQKLSHNWFLPFDNITRISSEHSDLLCRAVSGTGFSKRELYSDDDDVIYNFKRCISINGINLLALKPDLLERCILLELERVPKEDRKQEQELLHDFYNDLPSILGAIFDAISKAISIKPGIVSYNLPRMADFALWGCAISEALGFTTADFIDAYGRNIEIQHDEVINENIEASFVLNFIKERDEWEGSATELLKEMKYEYAEDPSIKIPKTANALSKKLNQLKTNLEEAGISVQITSGRKRKIILTKNLNYKEVTASIASLL